MFARVLTTAALGVGVLLGAIAVAAAPGVALGAAAFGAFIGALGFVWVRDGAPGDAATAARTGRRGGLIAGTGVTGGCLTLTGLVVVLGPASGVVLLLLAMTVCAVWWWRRRTSGAEVHGPSWNDVRDGLVRASQRPDPLRVAPVGAPPTTPWSALIPGNLSTPQLCLAWQRTYFMLLDLPAGAPRAELASLRGRLLDEIERRDPDGFTRWLDTGARAGSDPGRYLAGER